MEVLWGAGEMPARQVAAVLKDSTGWNVNTTYTLIKRCMEKGAVEREDHPQQGHPRSPLFPVNRPARPWPPSGQSGPAAASVPPPKWARCPWL